MGVTGLLPLLKSISRPGKLDKFSGQTIGIDGYGWLHRGAHCCALELVQGKDTRKYVGFSLQRIRMLRHSGVNPYFVFDGDYLPSKASTEASREARRNAGRKLALQLLAAGKETQALQESQKCVDVTPEMARELITELKRLDVPYVVAPYEADAQLVYLERQGVIDGILSEDSDLLVFGARRLLTKLDKFGYVVEIDRTNFFACREVSLAGWSDADFRRMAIFSGCDYLKGLPNVGLKKAHQMVRKYKTPEKAVRMVQLEGKIRVPENYLADFAQAELTFLHQRVYCPRREELVFLTDLEPGRGIEDLPFIGGPVEPELARAVAKGDTNPITKLPIIPIRTPDSAKRRLSQASGLNDGPDNVPARAGANAAQRPPLRPIDSYFSKPRRIPLGEMDVNCFSVDKQQVAVLTNNGRAPIVTPMPRPYVPRPYVPRPYVPGPSGRPAAATAAAATATPAGAHPPRSYRRRTEPIERLLASHGTARSSTHQVSPDGFGRPATSDRVAPDEAPPRAFSATAPRPCKKARLYHGTEEDGLLPALKSRFFPVAAPAPGPESPRRSGGFPMSDRSLDEALADLPDFDGDWPADHARRPLKIFSDGQEASFAVSSAANSGEDTEGRARSSPGSAEIPTSPGAQRSWEIEEEDGSTADRVEVPASPPPETRFRHFVQRFSHGTAGASPSPAPSSGLATPPSTASRRASSVFTPAPAASSVSTPFTRPSTGPGPHRPGSFERMGARALGRPLVRVPPSPAGRQPSGADRAALGPGGASGKRAGSQLSAFPPNPSFVPLPRVSLAEVDALNRPCGSEDELVPTSDDENDDENERGENGDYGRKMGGGRVPDLSRFAYVPARSR